MPVVPPFRPVLVVVQAPVSGADPDHEDYSGTFPGTRTCRRCRRSFARHPSVCSEDTPTRWLCPACDRSSAGRGPRARLRVVGAPTGPDPGPVRVARESAS